MKFSALLEIGVVVIMAGFFIRAPTSMWFYLFHLIHVARAVMGLTICQKVPYPQNFILKLKKSATDGERMSFEEYAAHVEAKLEESVALMFKQTKDYLLVYSMVTVVTIILDNFDMAIQFLRFAQPGNDYSEVVITLAICFLQVTNYIWFAWMMHANLRMPTTMKSINKAFLGFTSDFVKEATMHASAAKAKAQEWRDARRAGAPPAV
jgi:hypothetical protein